MEERQITGKYEIWRERADFFHVRWCDESVNVHLTFLVGKRWFLSPRQGERDKKKK